ncbi:MAG: SMEK domain-containing protein [Alkalinema sp. RU_4_3]|nr:SMEK domain-containing protein [Alkalinema sp. RU_4_3]
MLARFKAQVELSTAMSKTDLNKAAEDILIPLLNEIYGWNLININYAEDNDNYPGIDLVDKQSGISVQVTATRTLPKIHHTLQQFVKHNQYKTYPRLIIFILGKRQKTYGPLVMQKCISWRNIPTLKSLLFGRKV